MPPARLALPLLLVVPAALALPAGPALAHTALEKSTPASGAVLPAATREVALRFTGDLRAELTAVVLTGPDAADAARGRARVRGGQVVQAVDGPLAPGAWTLAYRVVAADGHPVTGTVAFTVTAAGPTGSPAGPASADPAPLADPPATTGAGQTAGGPPVLPALATAAALAGGSVLLLRRRSAR